MDKNDHPELDDTELLAGESIQHYLTMIDQLQWLVTVGRFDIHTQVTTLSRFRSSPRKGHLERLQKIYGYVRKTKHYSVRYRTEEPDYSYLPNMKMTGPMQLMAMFRKLSLVRKLSPMTVPNLFANQ